jgi:squalene/oxidosqualene cyclase-like protein
MFVAANNQNAGDRLLRTQQLKAGGSGLEDNAAPRSVPASPEVALSEAIKFYSALQTEDGHWAADYGGPMFLLPGLVITCHITGVDLGPHRKSAIVTYLLNHQQEDGGWGLHIESPSTMFGTVMSYVTLRLCGVAPDDAAAVAGRTWIREHGGATLIASWGKFWLAALGVYDWDGLNPLTPELWVLPYWFPLHPARMWCHCRMVYLPMCYVYGKRALPKLTPLLSALRSELYCVKYDSIDWNAARFQVCVTDLYSPHTWIADRMFDLLRGFERVVPSWLRTRALNFVASYMDAEDLQTNYVDIGPVNKVLNMLAVWYVAGGPTGGNKDIRFQKHAARVEDYLWVAEDGMKMQGYNGSQLWDTAFAAQAICDSGAFAALGGQTTVGVSLSFAGAGLVKQANVKATLALAYKYIDDTQISEDVPERAKFFRHISKGGWPFSTKDHGWPISDCTAEGLKAALAIRHSGVKPAGGYISDGRLYDAVEVILSFQNSDGGWATYELNRGWDWYEWFNPAEVFGDIMIDYTYVECTSACVTALAAFAKDFPHHRTREVQRAIRSGADFIRNYQRPDGKRPVVRSMPEVDWLTVFPWLGVRFPGGFYGKWAVCFTYGAWFGVEGLLAAGEVSVGLAPVTLFRVPHGNHFSSLFLLHSQPLSSKRFDLSNQFLLSKQREDGGWGESYLSCVTKEYQTTASNVVNTSWALLALMKGGCKDVAAVQRGITFLTRKQLSSGDWSQENISGIFNRTTGITYTAYRNVFPIWALGVYVNHYVPSVAAK